MGQKQLLQEVHIINNYKRTKFAIIGAGCGGQAIAGYLAAENYNVNLYNRSIERIEPLITNKTITLGGAIKRTGTLSYVGTDIAKAMAGRDIIMVVTTATGHRDIAALIAPHLKDGQIVILNPGRTFGALEFDSILRRSTHYRNTIVAEANTLLFAARVNSPGIVNIKGIKREVSIAALRAYETDKVISMIQPVFPQFIPASSVLETSFGNIGAVFHPVITLMNRDLIRKGQPFEFYIDGITKKSIDMIKAVDKEMRYVSMALGLTTLSVTEWLASRYGLTGDDPYHMIRSNPTYKGIMAPDTLDHRYLWEDIPTGLVPVSSIGKALNIETRVIDSLIDLADETLGRDFRSEGRTLESLCLSPRYLMKDLRDIIFPEETKVA